MLATSWIYFAHNLIITYITLGILNQLFYIRVDKTRNVLYVIWMQLFFIVNDFVIQVYLPLEYKYPFIFIGFIVGFLVFLRLPIVASMLFMIINLAVNGIATNLNIFTLLINQFTSYGLALENDFYQYTSLVMVMMMMYMILKTFNVRILDISRYN